MPKLKPKGDWTDALFFGPGSEKKKSPKVPTFIGDCPYCGDAMIDAGENSKKRPTRDHVMARSLGYSLQENKIVCCQECNAHKRSDTLVLWLIRLLKKRDRRAGRVKSIIEDRYRAGRLIDTLPIDGSKNPT